MSLVSIRVSSDKERSAVGAPHMLQISHSGRFIKVTGEGEEGLGERSAPHSPWFDPP